MFWLNFYLPRVRTLYFSLPRAGEICMFWYEKAVYSASNLNMPFPKLDSKYSTKSLKVVWNYWNFGQNQNFNNFENNVYI